jgi:hypothetical protein
VTKTITWDQWQPERRKTVGALARMADKAGDVRRRRIRSDEERRALKQANLDTVARAYSSGRIVWIDDRHMELCSRG